MFGVDFDLNVSGSNKRTAVIVVIATTVVVVSVISNDTNLLNWEPVKLTQR